jgi:hypothetical protein
MKIEKADAGNYRIMEGEDVLVLNRLQYEDIFYAIPLDAGAMYLLISETVLTDQASVKTLKGICDKAGGLEKALAEMQDIMSKMPPEPDKPAEVSPGIPLITVEPEKPREKAPAPAPVLPGPVVTIEPEAAEAKAQKKEPAKAAKAEKAAKKKKESRQPEKKAAEIPTAPVVKPPTEHPPAKPGMPVTKPPTVHPPAKPGDPPPEDQSALEVPPGPLKIEKTPKGNYQVSVAGWAFHLSPSKIKAFKAEMPMTIGQIFNLLMSKLLTDSEEKAAFRKMIAGARMKFLDELQKKIGEIR